MPAPRKPLTVLQEQKSYVVRFRHPVSQKVLRWKLGRFPLDAQIAESKVNALNRVFLNEAQWLNPGLPADLKEMWIGAKAGVRILPSGEGVAVDGVKVAATETNIAAYLAIIEGLQNELAAERAEKLKFKRQTEHLMGGKVREGPSPTLQQALEKWTKLYVGRDRDHTRIVLNDLRRFVAKFGADREIDSLDGMERDIDAWVRGLTIVTGKRKGEPLSAGRRQQMRVHILRFMKDNGVRLEAAQIHRPSRADVRTDRGGFRWLSKPQAEALAGKLSEPWGDLFRVQVGLGLRPDEVITLHRSNFTADLSRVTLSPLGSLTLKQGPRTIIVPSTVRTIVGRRLKAGDVIFPDPSTKAAWKDPKKYNRSFRTALRAAVPAVNFVLKVKEQITDADALDCRTGRRTCGSLLLRAGSSIEEVAAILGDNPQTVREHYAAILSSEVDPR